MLLSQPKSITSWEAGETLQLPVWPRNIRGTPWHLDITRWGMPGAETLRDSAVLIELLKETRLLVMETSCFESRVPCLSPVPQCLWLIRTWLWMEQLTVRHDIYSEFFRVPLSQSSVGVGNDFKCLQSIVFSFGSGWGAWGLLLCQCYTPKSSKQKSRLLKGWRKATGR